MSRVRGQAEAVMREDDESGNDGGLRRRPGGHASTLFFLPGPRLRACPQPSLSPHPPPCDAPRPAAHCGGTHLPHGFSVPSASSSSPFPHLPLSSFLQAVCWFHCTLTLEGQGADGEAQVQEGCALCSVLGSAAVGGEGREDHRAVLGPWRRGGGETPHWVVHTLGSRVHHI